MEMTAKARQTRELILGTALRLFAEKGYEETTLREIAREAGVSLGLSYRYFASKEDLVLAMYERLSDEAAAQSQKVQKGSLAMRFGRMLDYCLDGLAPHRNAMSSLFSVGLNAKSEMAVLGERASTTRNVMWGLYREIAAGATDAPKGRQLDQIATILYTIHLLMMLFWLQDMSENQSRTRALVKFAEGLLRKARPFMGLPIFANSVAELSNIIGPMFSPTLQPTHGTE